MRSRYLDFDAADSDIEAAIGPVLAELELAHRTEETARELGRLVACGAIGFGHDPDEGEPVQVESSWFVVERLNETVLAGEFVPAAERVAEAFVAALEDDRIALTFEGPWDSCSGCGGYHNVNYDCSEQYD